MNEGTFDEKNQETSSIKWEVTDTGLRWTSDGSIPDIKNLVKALTDQHGLDLDADSQSNLTEQLRTLEGEGPYAGDLDVGTEDDSNETLENDEEITEEEPTSTEADESVTHPHIKYDIQEDGSITWEADDEVKSYKEVTKHISDTSGKKITDVGAHAVMNTFSVKESNPDLPLIGIIATNYLKDNIMGDDHLEEE